MRMTRAILQCAISILLATVPLLAGDVKVIANPSVQADAISLSELKAVFLRYSNSLKDGSHVEPVIEQRGAVHDIFVRQYLGKSSDELQTYYDTLVFTGKAAKPRTFRSDQDLVAYVAKTRGAIGYVDSTVQIEGTKSLAILPDEEKTARVVLTRVDPEFPEALRERKIGGVVKLQVTVSAKGNVEAISTIGGNPILVDAATKAVKQWVYAPYKTRSTEMVSISF